MRDLSAECNQRAQETEWARFATRPFESRRATGVDEDGVEKFRLAVWAIDWSDAGFTSA